MFTITAESINQMLQLQPLYPLGLLQSSIWSYNFPKYFKYFKHSCSPMQKSPSSTHNIPLRNSQKELDTLSLCCILSLVTSQMNIIIHLYLVFGPFLCLISPLQLSTVFQSILLIASMKNLLNYLLKVSLGIPHLFSICSFTFSQTSFQ